jgi:hypothetical protein
VLLLLLLPLLEEDFVELLDLVDDPLLLLLTELPSRPRDRACLPLTLPLLPEAWLCVFPAVPEELPLACDCPGPETTALVIPPL